MNRKSNLWRKGEGDLGCLFLILILLSLGGCVSCEFSGCGIKISINNEEKK